MPNTYTQPDKSGLSSRIDTLVYYALLLLIVLSPIPFGSNRNWSWSLCAFITAILALTWAVNAICSQRKIPLSLPTLIIVLFLLPCFWVALQVSTSMPQAWSHPLWAMTSETLNTSIHSTISLTPDHSLTALMRLMSYGLVFFLSYEYGRNPNRAHTTLKWLAIAGFLYAAYGLINYWGNISMFFWLEPDIPVTKVSSTFVNRNTYVSYAGLGLICLMALSLSHSRQPPGPQDISRYASLNSRQQQIESFIFRSWKPLLGLMIITTALISTQSRGGVISSAIALVTLLLIYMIKRKRKTKFLLAGFASMCLIILLAYSISNEPLLNRMEHIDTGGSERITVFKLTLGAIKDNPWAGFGYGGFDQGFKLYRDEEVQYIYDKTHNTYLENSFELGIPAATSLFLTVLGLMWLTLRGVMHRRRDWIYPATGLAATTLIAIHSLIDFSLQIPAVAITYSAIMGFAVAQSYSNARHQTT